YWPAKLHWLARTEPETFRRTSRWLSFAEYALGRLCDAAASAVTGRVTSRPGLLDVHSLIWDEAILAAVGISAHRLSPLAELGPNGRLPSEIAVRRPATA